MGKVLTKTVHYLDDSGELHTIRAGEEAPSGVTPKDHWFATTDQALDDLEDEEIFEAANANGPTEPGEGVGRLTGGPPAGGGDADTDAFAGVSVKKLRQYAAEETDVDLSGAKNRAEVVTALEDGGVDPVDVREWAGVDE